MTCKKGQMACHHTKVYSNCVLMCSPPIYSWICSECGEKGSDRGTFRLEDNYDDLCKKFKDKETK